MTQLNPTATIIAETRQRWQAGSAANNPIGLNKIDSPYILYFLSNMECHGKCLHCPTTRPQYLLDINNFMCADCNTELRPIMGKHENTKEIEECCICFCNDKLCAKYNCLCTSNKNICQDCILKIKKCPLCRTNF